MKVDFELITILTLLWQCIVGELYFLVYGREKMWFYAITCIIEYRVLAAWWLIIQKETLDYAG